MKVKIILKLHMDKPCLIQNYISYQNFLFKYITIFLVFSITKPNLKLSSLLKLEIQALLNYFI